MPQHDRAGQAPFFMCAAPKNKNNAHMLVPARRVKAPVARKQAPTLQAAARSRTDGVSRRQSRSPASQQRPPTTPAVFGL